MEQARSEMNTGEAEAALQPAPAADPRRRAVHLRLPADGHLRRQQPAQVDAARRRVDPPDRDRLLAVGEGSHSRSPLLPGMRVAARVTMLAYVLRRLLQSLLVLLGVSVIVFGLLHLTGDPTRLLLPLEAREEDVRQLRALLGLDDPLWVQYLRFLSRAVRGDFGLSFKHQVPGAHPDPPDAARHARADRGRPRPGPGRGGARRHPGRAPPQLARSTPSARWASCSARRCPCTGSGSS